LVARPDSAGRRVLDVLVLSHFDSDHLNGVRILAGLFHVRRVLVPHLTPEDLPLVLASQSSRWFSQQNIRVLHELAHGGRLLFGVPVTRVLPTNGQIPPDPSLERDGPAPSVDQREDSTTEASTVLGNMDAIDTSTGGPLGDLLAPDGDVAVQPAGGSPIPLWTLRFWNRGSDSHLRARLEHELRSIHFPVDAVQSRDQVGRVLDWFRDLKLRDRTVDAYKRALAAHPPWCATGPQMRAIGNHLSMGMYSGPLRASGVSWASLGYDLHAELGKDASVKTRRYRGSHESAHGLRTAWLGTGDAPLGEHYVWADFAKRFAAQLGEVITVQVPHHGAAPKNGPLCFNAGLVAVPGVNAVVSYGKKNQYGHPHPDVLDEICLLQGRLIRVTDVNQAGFFEHYRFRPLLCAVGAPGVQVRQVST
jgi:hypothetical protein